MKLIGRRSNDMLIGVAIGLVLLISAILGVFFVGSNIIAEMLVPILVGLCFIITNGYNYFTYPFKAIFYDEENESLVVNLAGGQSKTIKLQRINKMYLEPSGFIRKKVGNIILVYTEEGSDYDFKSQDRTTITVKYIANANDVTSFIAEKKENVEDNKFKAFN